MSSTFSPINKKPKQKPAIGVLIVSNGPGELSTWVRPIAESLHNKLLIRPKSKNANISLQLILVPCPNATGNEAQAAANWELFDRILQAKHFWSLLINPKNFGSWPSKGVVIFLGGDQFWSVLLSARLKYRHITYAEWVSRWPYWNDRIAAMSPKVKNLLPKRLKKRCVVVGDLMADLQEEAKKNNPLPKGMWVAILPGSKKSKLCVGIPFFLEVADKLADKFPNCNFLLPVAPTTNVNEFEEFSNPKTNRIASIYSSGIKEITEDSNTLLGKVLITTKNSRIQLLENQTAHSLLIQCDLALTTVGANTAELGALGVPMIVVVPTQHLNVMEAWDGFLGIIGRLPVLKKLIGLLISLWRLRKNRYLAWPNISANKMIVPERIGKISPDSIAQEASEWLLSPSRLAGQKEDLITLRGKKGAVNSLSEEIIQLIPKEYG